MAEVTFAMAKSTGELAVVLNETSPARLPVPAFTSCAKSETASRAASILVRPVPSSIDMLPERSNTSTTSRVTGGGGAGTRSARIFFVGQ